jgi:hypothetical protein
LTGGADFDGQPGDDGLAVVLEPRNGADQYVPQAGPVSVVVLDPARQGDAARVARWDFDLSATRQKLAAASPARGLKFELPWPAAPPANSHLKVFVRYETPDGRRLTTDREVYLASANETRPGWTPRTGASVSASEQVASLPPPPGARNAIEGVPSSAPVAVEPARLAPAITPSAPLAPPAALSAGAAAAAQPAWSPNR